MLGNWFKTTILMAGIVILFGAVSAAQIMIINPFSGDGIKGLFSTHPQTEERVARLMEMAQGVA